MELILFDIDLTLVLTSGVGRKALNDAVHELFGIEGAFEGVQFAGRTDRSITAEGLSLHGLDSSEPSLLHLRSAFVRRLSGSLSSPDCPIMPLPGAAALLSALGSSGGFAIGLVTGNWREGAWLKLARCGLDGFFRSGAFAEDGMLRRELPPMALSRARAVTGIGFLPGDCWVVGDTPDDMDCGSACGMRTLGVATGPYGADVLEKAGATAVLPDLKDTAEVLRALAG